MPCRRECGVELLAQTPVPDPGPEPPQGFQGGRVVDLGQRVDRGARELEVLGHAGLPGGAGAQRQGVEVRHRGRAVCQGGGPDRAAREVAVVPVDDVVVVVVAVLPGGLPPVFPAAQRFALGQGPQRFGDEVAPRCRFDGRQTRPAPALCGTRRRQAGQVPYEAGQFGPRGGGRAGTERSGPRRLLGEEPLGDLRTVHERQQGAEPTGEGGGSRSDLRVQELRVRPPQPGRDRTEALVVQTLCGGQGGPERVGEPEAHVVLGGAQQHHRDLGGRPPAHPPDQGTDLGVVLPQCVAEARGQQQAQDRGPALLVPAGGEARVDLGLYPRVPRVGLLGRVRTVQTRPELGSLTFQKIDEPPRTGERARPHVVERVVPAGLGRQGVVEHGGMMTGGTDNAIKRRNGKGPPQALACEDPSHRRDDRI